MDATELVQAIQTLNAEDAFRPRLDAQQWRVFAQYLTREYLGKTLCPSRDKGPW